MKFLFTTFNHGRQGQIILEDVTGIMGGQLAALGHEVLWSNREFVEDGYNVVIESFADDPATIERIADAHARGRRFVYVATEEPTPKGFNSGLDPAMVERQEAFARAAPYASGILHLIPGDAVNRWYAQHAPAAHAELGHAASFVCLEPAPIEPPFLFGFYGKATWRRDQIIKTLEAKTGISVIRCETLDLPRPTLVAAMRHARVVLQIRANEEWGMVSSTRCASALCLGRPVAAEPHPSPAPWSEVLTFSETLDAFYDDAIAAARGDWRQLHRWQMARFVERLTPERCVGEPLRKIGILA